jgi:hypothetical protein
MSNSSSYTFNESKDNSGKKQCFFQVTGCTEYPALNWGYSRHVLIPIFAFQKDNSHEQWLNRLFDKDYTNKQYVIDYINMVLDILRPINERTGRNLFEVYTFKNYKDDTLRKLDSKSCSKIPFDETGILAHTINSYCTKAVGYKDDEPFGIVTNCQDIRTICKAKNSYTSFEVERCRNIQFAHTMLRLIYSSGWYIPLIALKIYKDYKINPLYALWIAYHIRGVVDGHFSDYGDIFYQNAEFVSEEEVVKRFFDPKENGSLQGHFRAQENKFAEYFKSSVKSNFTNDADMTRLLIKKSISWENVVNVFAKGGLDEEITSIMKMATESISGNFVNVKFSFTRKLFNSIITNTSYSGIEMPNSKLGRVIFKDENETVLSVLKTSKFIQLA